MLKFAMMNRGLRVFAISEVIIVSAFAFAVFLFLANEYERTLTIIAERTIIAPQTEGDAAMLSAIPPTRIASNLGATAPTRTPTSTGGVTPPLPTPTALPSTGGVTPPLPPTPRPFPTWRPLSTSRPNFAAGERVNVLLLGIDRRPSEKCPCRTDTMMLATLDPKTNSAGLVTIPRDLYVLIPGVGEYRINEANFFGESHKFPGGGAALAKQTVESNLGRKIHFYARVDFAGFRKIIDTLGGIDIDVPRAIDDPSFPDYDFGIKPLHIPAGHVHMDGERALEYVRTRHVDGDFARSRRQIQVLMAVRDKALRLDLLPKIPLLLQQVWGAVETDLSPQDIFFLAQAAAKVQIQNIKMASIDGTMTVEFRTIQGADVLLPDREKIGRLIGEIIP